MTSDDLICMAADELLAKQNWEIADILEARELMAHLAWQVRGLEKALDYAMKEAGIERMPLEFGD